MLSSVNLDERRGDERLNKNCEYLISCYVYYMHGECTYPLGGRMRSVPGPKLTVPASLPRVGNSEVINKIMLLIDRQKWGRE